MSRLENQPLIARPSEGGHEGQKASERQSLQLASDCWKSMGRGGAAVSHDVSHLLGSLEVSNHKEMQSQTEKADLTKLAHDLTEIFEDIAQLLKDATAGGSNAILPPGGTDGSSGSKPEGTEGSPAGSKPEGTQGASAGSKPEGTQGASAGSKPEGTQGSSTGSTPEGTVTGPQVTKVSSPNGTIKFDQSQPVYQLDATKLTAGNGNAEAIPKDLMEKAQSFGAVITNNYDHVVQVNAGNFNEIMSKPLQSNTSYVFADGDYKLDSNGLSLPSNVQFIAKDSGAVNFGAAPGSTNPMLYISKGANNVDISGINFAAGSATAVDVAGSNVKIENSNCTNANDFLQIENGAHNVTAQNVNVDRVNSYAVYANPEASNVLLDQLVATGSVQQWTVRSYANNTAVVSSTIQNEANLYGTNKGSLALYGDSQGGNALVLDSVINQVPKAGEATSGKLFDTTAMRIGHLEDTGFPSVNGQPFKDLPTEQQVSWFKGDMGNIHSWLEVQEQAPALAQWIQNNETSEAASLQEADKSTSNAIVYGSKITGTVEGGSHGSSVTVAYSTVDSSDSGSPFSAAGNESSVYSQVFPTPGNLTISNSLIKDNAGNPLVLNGGGNEIHIGDGVSYNGQTVE